MLNKDDFTLGKLYYHCSWTLGKYPIPEIEAYILDRMDEDGLHFIKPEELNARGPLAKLSLEDQGTIRNMMDGDRGLFVPYSELENMFSTPQDAIEFLKRSFEDPALDDLF